MSPPRRRSSRLKGAAAKVCLDLVAMPPSPPPPLTRLAQSNKATPELDSIVEVNNVAETPSRRSARQTPNPEPATPVSSAVKPSDDEMNPGKYHPSTAPPNSALRLGFSDIRPANIDINGMPGALIGTPTRVSSVPQSQFTFRFGREATDLKLGENAQRLLNELRQQADVIKADMVAQREAEVLENQDRKIAKPKGQSGRFSAAHLAEFKKMDSIEGHASAWRANRTTPVKNDLKRSASKANLEPSPTPMKPSLKRSSSTANLDATPQAQTAPSLKHSTSRRNLGGQGESFQRGLPGSVPSSLPRSTKVTEPTSSFAKRIKKYQGEDASNARPVSRDDSSIPRPKSSGQGSSGLPHSQSSLARLMSPTKASISHLANRSTPTITLVNPEPQKEPDSLKATTPKSILTTPSKAADLKRRIISPNFSSKVKSILRGDKTDPIGARTAIPKPAIKQSLTPGPSQTEKSLPPLPLTTPRRKLAKKVSFTPDTKRAAEMQTTPSPQKHANRLVGAGVSKSAQYSSLNGILTESKTEPTSGEVKYPDLSAFGDLAKTEAEQSKILSNPGPGTFSFRSDHTINFGGSPASGFGAFAGQASVRQVRPSLAPKANMPGSFPVPPSPSTHSNKENRAPQSPAVILGAAHGMSNKKRHRATWDEEDAEKEAADRAAKKQKNEHVPEGHALVAPRLIAKTPTGSAKKMQAARGVSRTPGSVGSASPSKKKMGISLSRLNMLSRPKIRS